MGVSHRFRSLSLLVLCLLILAAAFGSSPASAQGGDWTDQGEGGALFNDVAPDAAALPPATEITLTRSRLVTVNFGLLSDKVASLSLPLFEDATFGVALTGVDQTGDGGYVLKGHIADQGPESVVTLSVLEGTLQGNISTGKGEMYQIRYVAGGVHAISQVDPAGFGEDGDSILPAPTVEELAEAGDMAAASSESMLPPTINVLVVYTDDARAAAGGATAINNLVNLAVSETNTGYSNSGVNQRISLVYKGEVNYGESGTISTDLSRLRSTTDGQVDSVHSLRNTYAADLVSMVVENGGGYCGIAYLMSTVSTSFKTNGFSVVARNCATGYYSFGHELGHNMGARHDSYVDGNTTPYPYSHGWVNVSARWRTIMAYNDRCAASGVSCTRINYWSNTTRTYGGAVMGNASTANNARTLNNTANTVAAFR